MRVKLSQDELERVVRALQHHVTVDPFTGGFDADRQRRLLREWRTMRKEEFNARFVSPARHFETSETVTILAFRRVLGVDPRKLHESTSKGLAI